MPTPSAMVFGGARGIGRVVAEAFLVNGYALTIVARTEEQLGATAAALSAKGSIQGYAADVSLYRAVQGAMDAHVQKYGVPSAIVNTAAVQGPMGPVWDNDPERWRTTLLTNLLGSFHICRAALPMMLEKDFGTLILFSGGGAAYARPFFSAYGTSKTGVLRLVETVHEEIREAGRLKHDREEEEREAKAAKATGEVSGQQGKDRGVRIYAVAPGAVYTRMTEEVLANGEQAGRNAYREALKTSTEGGVTPERAAELSLFLAAERPSCLSGKLIHVNEPYREYVESYEGRTTESGMIDSGLLRRVSFRHV